MEQTKGRLWSSLTIYLKSSLVVHLFYKLICIWNQLWFLKEEVLSDAKSYYEEKP